jgi:hypothetical protein
LSGQHLVVDFSETKTVPHPLFIFLIAFEAPHITAKSMATRQAPWSEPREDYLRQYPNGALVCAWSTHHGWGHRRVLVVRLFCFGQARLLQSTVFADMFVRSFAQHGQQVMQLHFFLA